MNPMTASSSLKRPSEPKRWFSATRNRRLRTPRRRNAGSDQSPAAEGLRSEQLKWLIGTARGAALVAGVASLLAGEMILKAYESDLFPPLKYQSRPRRHAKVERCPALQCHTDFHGDGWTARIDHGSGRRTHATLGSCGTRAAILGFLLGTTVVAPIGLVERVAFLQAV